MESAGGGSLKTPQTISPTGSASAVYVLCMFVRMWADAGLLKGGSNLSPHAKRGSALCPMLNSLHRGPKGGGGGVLDPLDPYLDVDG